MAALSFASLHSRISAARRPRASGLQHDFAAAPFHQSGKGLLEIFHLKLVGDDRRHVQAGAQKLRRLVPRLEQPPAVDPDEGRFFEDDFFGQIQRHRVRRQPQEHHAPALAQHVQPAVDGGRTAPQLRPPVSSAVWYHVSNSRRPLTPMRVASLKMTFSVKSSVTGFGGSPRSTMRPPLRSMSSPLSMPAGWPDISSTTSAPRPCVSSRTRDAGSSPGPAASTASAPMRRASSRRYGLGSMANTADAPARRATAMATRPMGPQPTTATRRPDTPAAMTVCTALPKGS